MLRSIFTCSTHNNGAALIKLFAVRHIPSNRLVPKHEYANKPAAKVARDELIAVTGDKHVVTYGPDHRKYNQAS